MSLVGEGGDEVRIGAVNLNIICEGKLGLGLLG